MKYFLFALMLCTALFRGTALSQHLMNAAWEKAICTDSIFMDGIIAITHDEQGNIYSLGAFPDIAGSVTSLGETLDSSNGCLFLTKQSCNGDKLFAKSLGGSDAYSGCIRICSNGDLIIGFNYSGDCKLWGRTLATEPGRTSIILRLDSNLTLRWFRTFRNNSGAGEENNYLEQMILDRDDNVYYAIKFADIITIDTTNFGRINHYYQTVVGKLGANGDFLWAHHYHSDAQMQGACYPGSLLLKPGGSGDTLLAIGRGADSLFIDGSYQAAPYVPGAACFMSILSAGGDVLAASYFDKDLDVNNLKSFGGKVYATGGFSDTVFAGGKTYIPANGNSTFISELDTRGTLLRFADLQTNAGMALSCFEPSARYGFVVGGKFYNSMDLQGAHASLPFLGSAGSFIANLDDSLHLIDWRYIAGGSYKLELLTIHKQYITGAADYEDTCSFSNRFCWANNEDVSIFQTTDLKPLHPDIYPLHVSHPAAETATFSILPNPCASEATIAIGAKDLPTLLSVVNTTGQVMMRVALTEPSTHLDLRSLHAGLYLLSVPTAKNVRTVRLLKERITACFPVPVLWVGHCGHPIGNHISAEFFGHQIKKEGEMSTAIITPLIGNSP